MATTASFAQIHCKFQFLEIISIYEHTLVLNLPWELDTAQESAVPLSRQFCSLHFLAGVLLSELNTMLKHDDAVFAIIPS